MKNLLLLFTVILFTISTIQAQSPIEAVNMATYNAYSGAAPDSATPYFGDLGVRRVIVADADGDGDQEVLATDYSNGGRVHVMEYDGAGNLEIIWSSPVSTTSSGSTPRFPRVGDCDGDGNPEIIFEQNGEARIVLYEWDGSSWGTEPAFEITNDMFLALNPAEVGIRFNREVFQAHDFDGDGKTEIIPYGNGPRRDIYILGIEGQFPGFASLVMEGGLPPVPNGRNWVGGSQWSSTPADIDGDGKLEIINHHWDSFGIWAIDVDGTDSYTYPDTSKPGVYHKYHNVDALSYFGLTAADVDGDGSDEIGGTLAYNLANNNFDMVLFDFYPYETTPNLFYDEPDSIAKRYGIIASNADLSALGGRTSSEYWPCVSGDVNQDGKDEIYTGGGRGVNLIAVQYNGSGSLTDPSSYSSNLVYAGEGGDVFATIKIYNGRLDTVIVGEDTSYVLNPAIKDTVYEETPFTSYIFADGVDIDQDGKMEIVLSEQSVYDSTTIIEFVWVDSTQTWERDNASERKIVNEYRRTVRVLEYTGTTGLVDQGYNVVTPEDYILENNYPNPFNPSTALRFTLPLNKQISLKIYDMLGKEVAILINNEVFEKGSHELQWNGTNNSGQKVASGNYIATLIYGNYSKSVKMTLLK